MFENCNFLKKNFLDFEPIVMAVLMAICKG